MHGVKFRSSPPGLLCFLGRLSLGFQKRNVGGAQVVCPGSRIFEKGAQRDWTFVGGDGKRPPILTGNNTAANDGIFPSFDG